MTKLKTLAWAEKEIPPHALAAIGLVIVTAARAEGDLGFCLMDMIHIRRQLLPEAWLLIAGMDFKVKIKLLLNIATKLKLDGLSDLQKDCYKLGKAIQIRNNLAHGLIIRGRSADEIQVVDPKMPSKRQNYKKYHTTEKLKNDARSIALASSRLKGRLKELGITRPSELQTPTPPGK